MSDKRLIVDEDYNWIDTKTGYCIEMEDAFELVNQLWEENEQLRTQLLICQQFKVWQVPPIPKGMRITTTTTGEKDE